MGSPEATQPMARPVAFVEYLERYVKQMAEEDASLKNKTRVIFKSPPFGMPPLVVPRQIDPQRKQQLQNVLLSMDTDPEGKKILETLRIERFVVPDAALFDSVRQAAESFEASK